MRELYAVIKMYTAKQNKTKLNINNKNGSSHRKFTVVPPVGSAL
jgi:hypothetical protein